MKNIFFTDESLKINWFNSERYCFTDESVKRQITDSISENSTDSDLESELVNLDYWKSLFTEKARKEIENQFSWFSNGYNVALILIKPDNENVKNSDNQNQNNK